MTREAFTVKKEFRQAQLDDLLNHVANVRMLAMEVENEMAETHSAMKVSCGT